MNFNFLTLIPLALISCCCSLASGFSYAEVKPTSQEIVNAHLTCDSSVFKNYQWEKSSPINQIATNKIVIVSNVNFKTIPLSLKLTEKGYFNAYNLLFRYFDEISCARNDLAFIKDVYSNEHLKQAKIQDSFQEETYYVISAKDKKLSLKKGLDEYYYSLSSSAQDDESPLDTKQSALVCMIRIEDFIKDKNVVNIDKLCEGQPQTKKDLMKWAIGNLHEFYKSKYAEWKKTAKPDRK
ncbi:MAG: hypothetical protein HQK52_11385 [Oligoflexia bacterium]|nr:hypothetical protein [Oligoflexia bacterium]